MKFQTVLNNFTSGEWSPKMISRSDTDQYKKACKQLLNGIVQMQGGAFKRPGTTKQNLEAYQYILNEAAKLRIFPYNLSNGKHYLIIATEGYPGSSLGTGQYPWFVYDTDTGVVSSMSASNQVQADPYIDEAQFEQVGDILFIVSKGGMPRYITYDATDGFWTRVMWERNTFTTGVKPTWQTFPYGSIQSGNIDGTITATGTITVGGAVNLVSTNDQFAPEMVAAEKYCFFKLTHNGATGVVALTGYTSPTQASAVVLFALPAPSGHAYGAANGTFFQKSMWNGFDGWPRTIASYQGRLLFGGNTSYPDTLWGTRIGNIFDLDEVPFAQNDDDLDGVLDITAFTNDNSRPFTLTPNTKESSNINALSSAKTIMINTDRGEIIGYGTQGAFGPNDFNFESSTSFGSERVQPVRVNNFLTFVQRGGRKVRDVVYDNDEGSYKSTDLSFVADHLTVGDPIKETVAVEINSSVLFARTQSGRLLSVTLDRDYNVNGWSEHSIGGALNGGSPQVIAIASGFTKYSPDVFTDITEDSLYILIRRTSGGENVVWLEKLERFFEPDDATNIPVNGQIFPYYLDGAGTAISDNPDAPDTTFVGLTDWAGDTVSVLLDGNYIGEHTISASGTLTTPVEGRAVYFGHKYTFRLTPMPIEDGVQIGSSQGIVKRTVELYVRLYNTMGCKYGKPGNLYDIEFRTSDDPLNEPIPLFTGDKKLAMPPGYDRTYEVSLESDNPFPCNILGIAYKGMAYD